MRRLIFFSIIQQWLFTIHAKFVAQKFLKIETYDHMVICDSSLNDETLVEIMDNTYNQNVYTERWDCFGRVNNINRALIILNDPEPDLVANLLNQDGAQKSLTSNTWIIHSRRETNELLDYFQKNKLRLGINANIFIAKESGEDVLLYQALGLGTIFPQIKVNVQAISYNECIKYHSLIPHFS